MNSLLTIFNLFLISVVIATNSFSTNAPPVQHFASTNILTSGKRIEEIVKKIKMRPALLPSIDPEEITSPQNNFDQDPGRDVFSIESDPQGNTSSSNALLSQSKRRGKRMLTTGKKPPQCDFPGCERFFHNSADREGHARVHTREQPFKCPECQRPFSLLCNLKRHEKIVHTGERPFKCPACERSFSHSGNRNFHHKKAHNKKENSPSSPYEHNITRAMSDRNQIAGSDI